MGGRAEGLEGGDGRDDDFAKFAKKLKEDYGDPDDWDAESAPPESVEPKEEVEAEEAADPKEEFKAFTEHLEEKYGADGGAPDGDVQLGVEEATEPEDLREHNGHAKPDADPQVLSPPDDGDWWQDATGEGRVEPAEEIRREDPEQAGQSADDTKSGGGRQESQTDENQGVNRNEGDSGLQAAGLSQAELTPAGDRQDPKVQTAPSPGTPIEFAPAVTMAEETPHGPGPPEPPSKPDAILVTAQGEDDPKINISKTNLAELGIPESESQLLNVKLKNLESGMETTTFGQTQGDGKLRVCAPDAGKTGDRFEVLTAETFGFEDFAREFAMRRPSEMNNVSFSVEREKVFMGVDRDRFELLQPKLEAYNGQAVLTGQVNGHQMLFKFSFDGECFSAQIKDHKTIRSFDAYEGRLFVHHSAGYRDAHERQEGSIVAGLSVTAYRMPGRDDAIRFDAWQPTIERKGGIKFEAGKLYDIRGKVGGGDFTVCHRVGESPHINVFMAGEKAKEFEPGRKYDLEISSVSEQTILPVFDNIQGPVLRLSKRLLESRGIDTRAAKRGSLKVVEYQIQNQRSGERNTIFDRILPSIGHSIVNVDKIGRAGDKYELLALRMLTVEEFIEYFGRFKPRKLENVDLVLRENKLSMLIDGEEFHARHFGLDARNLAGVLRVESPEVKTEMNFWFDGKAITPKLGGHFPILSIRKEEDRVRIAYFAGGRLKEAFPWDWSGRPGTPELKAKDVQEMTRISSIRQRPTSTSVLFEANPMLVEYATSRLDDLRGNRYLKVKGDIGEEACSGILSHMGWRELVRHPFGGEEEGSNLHGPDSLMECGIASLPQLFEFKWWRRYNDAMVEAESEMKQFVNDNRAVLRDLGIGGGYISSLDWNPRMTKGALHLAKVWSFD